MTHYMSHTSMTIPGYGISLSLMCLVRNLYVMVYFENVTEIYLKIDNCVTRKVYFYPRTGFYFARVKTGQVGTWSPIE